MLEYDLARHDLPLLSVIIPTYNRVIFLRKCLDSLRKCDYPNLEIIVVDDGSTDDISKDVSFIKSFCTFLRQENQGPNSARNLGFTHAHGSYISFVDSDDQWFPGIARTVVQLLERYQEVDMIFTEAPMGNPEEGYQSWIEIAGEDQFFRLPSRQTVEGLRIFDKAPFFRRMLVRNQIFISAVIMRRDAFERTGKFDPSLRLAEDWEFWLRMASQCQLAFYPESLAYYTRHPGCASSDHDKMGEAFCAALKKIRQKCPHLGQDDLTILEQQLRLHLFGQAYRAYDCGDYRLARDRFARLQHEAGFSLQGMLYSSVCLLPPKMIHFLRRCKWLLGN